MTEQQTITITFSRFCRLEARKLQKDLASLNEFKHRDKFAVNYDLRLYDVCQRIIDCDKAGGDAGKLISDNISAEQKDYKKWLKNAKQTDNYDNPPPQFWLAAGMQIVVSARLRLGELTEEDLERAARRRYGND